MLSQGIKGSNTETITVATPLLLFCRMVKTKLFVSFVTKQDIELRFATGSGAFQKGMALNQLQTLLKTRLRHKMHIGNSIIQTSVKPLHLKQVLYVPKIQSNLLFVSKLCQSNGCSVEFFPNHFDFKDLNSGQALLQGPLKQDLYHLSIASTPSSSPQALHTSIQSASSLHHKLGHPSSKIIKHLIDSHHLPIKLPTSHECTSCHCAKSHKLHFSDHHLTSSKPLELLYSDVWGPAPVRSLDGYLYYLIIVDHFSKYVWLYPMKCKSDVFSIFVQFNSIVEK